MAIVVTIAATQPNASEIGPTTGTFTVTRAGGVAGDLTVNFVVGGTANEGTDFGTLGTTVVIPDGEASADITVTPIEDGYNEGTESVIVALSAGAGYSVGAPSSATVNIACAYPFQVKISTTATNMLDGFTLTVTATISKGTEAERIIRLKKAPGDAYANAVQYTIAPWPNPVTGSSHGICRIIWLELVAGDNGLPLTFDAVVDGVTPAVIGSDVATVTHP